MRRKTGQPNVRFPIAGTGRPTLRARLTLLAVSALFLCATPGVAHAATVSLEGDVLSFTAAPGERNTLAVFLRSDGYANVTGLGGPLTILTPDTCVPTPAPGEVACTIPSAVIAVLGDGDDTVRRMELPTVIDLGPGDDSAISGPGPETILGGPGSDKVSYPNSAAGTLARGAPVTVTLDGQADDGESGEGDNVDADIEIVQGTDHGDRLVGNDGAQQLVGSGGNDVLEGGGGDDILNGGTADDVLGGGAGNDELNGEAGRDRIDAGRGADHVRGDEPCRIVTCGGGPDEILVRDGETDTVQCGIGHDHVTADPQDGIQQDGLEICEAVDLPALPPPPTVITDPPPTQHAAGSLRVISGASLKRVLRRGIELAVTCPAACEVRATARVERATARRLKLNSTTIARGATRALAAGNSATITLRLNRRTRQRLGRARRLSVTLALSYRYATGAAPLSRQLNLRR